MLNRTSIINKQFIKREQSENFFKLNYTFPKLSSYIKNITGTIAYLFTNTIVFTSRSVKIKTKY
jgi:hypothetical protein